jgi:hypothetical protein
MADKEVKEVKETKEELVKLILDRPFITNGKALGWENIDGKMVFTGKVEVPADVAEDLQERMAVAQESDRARMRNDGKTIDAAPGGISVGGA